MIFAARSDGCRALIWCVIFTLSAGNQVRKPQGGIRFRFIKTALLRWCFLVTKTGLNALCSRLMPCDLNDAERA